MKDSDTFDNRVGKDPFGYYRKWEKYVLTTKIELPKDDNGKGYRRMTLTAFCLSLAIYGTNGIGCCIGDTKLAEQLGISNVRDLRRYRKLAIDLGWFKPTGEFRGRVELLDIAIPGNEPLVTEPKPKDTYRASAVKPAPAKPEPKAVPKPAVDPWLDENTKAVTRKPAVKYMTEAETQDAPRPVVPDDDAPKEHSGTFPIDCPRCEWYLLNRHPDHDRVTEEHGL